MTDTFEEVSGHGPVSLEHLIALNDEIVALTRSGMPLERGLLDLGSDLPGRLRVIALALGERMSRGQSLPEALAASGAEVPPVYKAVVEAGLRSGRLPIALEGLSTFARGYIEARRSIGLALWYPLLVLTLAYVLFLFILTTVIPRFLSAFQSLGVPAHVSMRLLHVLGENVWYWGPVFPIGLVLFLGAWSTSRRSSSLAGGGTSRFLRWFPWMGAMLKGFEAASFADLLALLIEHNVPYPEALALAGEASGDRAMARSSRELAAAVERGLAPAEALKAKSAFPPLLRWLLASGPRQGDFVTALKQMGARYRNGARHQADKIRVFLPTILLVGIGASATMLYALTLFLPLTTLWKGLAGQVP